MNYLALLLPLGLVWGQAQATGDEYAAGSTSTIKALSAEQINGYYQGKGMGLAKAAELNGYPGPKHVLELAEKLQLTTGQYIKTKELFVQVQREARELGEQVVNAEQQLNKLFTKRITAVKKMQQLTRQIALLQGRLRAVHLAAHIRQSSVLSEHQRGLYFHLRGYGSADALKGS